MGGVHKIDIVRALSDKAFEDFDKPFVADLHTPVFSADLKILAVNAFQIAAAEKYRSASALAAYAGLFPEMERRSGNSERFGGSAEA